MDEFIITHQILLCFGLSVLGGVVNYFDKLAKQDEPLKNNILLYKAFVAGFCGLTFCFLSWEVAVLTPVKRLGLSMIIGYGGTSFLDSFLNIKKAVIKLIISSYQGGDTDGSR